MALLVSETSCEIREVKLSAKPAELIAASDKATVPALVLPDGQMIDESLDIMRWALARNDPEGWLDGENTALIEAIDGPFKHHLDRAKYPERHQSEPAEHRAQCLAMLKDIEARLKTSPYLCGERLSLTDAAIMPFVRQFAAIDRNWFDARPLDSVQRWLNGLLRSALFESAMARFPVWRAGDPQRHLRR
jgi:glutathione S-transferase